MTDLRALLVEAREQMIALTPGLMRNFLVERIDAALAEKAPEPFATIYEMYAKHGSGRWLSLNPLDENGKAVRAIAVYIAPPSASPDDARDAARMEFLTESNRVAYIGGGTSGTWKFHIDHDGGEDLRHDIDVYESRHRAGGRGVSEILFFSRRLWCRIFGHHAKYEFMAPAYKLEDQGPVVAHCDCCGKRWLAGTL